MVCVAESFFLNVRAWRCKAPQNKRNTRCEQLTQFSTWISNSPFQNIWNTSSRFSLFLLSFRPVLFIVEMLVQNNVSSLRVDNPHLATALKSLANIAEIALAVCRLLFVLVHCTVCPRLQMYRRSPNTRRPFLISFNRTCCLPPLMFRQPRSVRCLFYRRLSLIPPPFYRLRV